METEKRRKWRNIVGNMKVSVVLVAMMGFPFINAVQPSSSPLTPFLAVLAFMMNVGIVAIGLRTNLLLRASLALFYLLSNGFLAAWFDSALYLGFFMAWGVICLCCLEPVMRRYIG